ncbi:Acb2/Tad1 domain-containing protein [Nonomuraea recticatena]|uniref:Acb2/Tad1 hairpin domain-containing protein n=1 Tax=Nonomuraea recticatena TaxID=46178 RepID=A0ABN3RPD4_9ACTN
MTDLHDQIDSWFTFHPPASEKRRQAHIAVRSGCRDLAHLLADTVPPGDELLAAVKGLRQVAMWANAGLALAADPDAPPEGGDRRPGVAAAAPGANLLADPVVKCPAVCPCRPPGGPT